MFWGICFLRVKVKNMGATWIIYIHTQHWILVVWVLICTVSDIYIWLAFIYSQSERMNKINNFALNVFCVSSFFFQTKEIIILLIVKWSYCEHLFEWSLKKCFIMCKLAWQALNKSTTVSVQPYICYLFNKSANKKKVNTLLLQRLHSYKITVILKHQVFPWIPSKWEHLL